MGNGRFTNGRLNFVASAAYVLNAAEKIAWQTNLQDASNFLYAATGGQVQFGDVYVVDDSFGRLDAEILLFNQNALSGGTTGKFGIPGNSVRLYVNDRGNPRILAHEMSHHVWNLGDEYASEMVPFQIDKSAPSPDRRTIPILNGPAQNTLANQQAILRFGDIVERRQIASNTGSRIVVTADYSDLPTNSTIDVGHRQDTNVSCGKPSITGVGFCIMEDSGPSVTEFCSPANHDSIQDTDQQTRHNASCWDTIVATSGFGALTIPNSSPANPAAAVNFIDILKENRFAVVFDRSGSMSGDKLAYAKEGVRYWIDSCTLASDLLSVVAYNANNNIILPITQTSAIPNLAALNGDIDAVTATGQTNIRDAVREGVSQIISLPNRAVSQAVIVLTDGKHNRPSGTRLTEALPDLLDNGVKAVTIAIGQGGGVDAADLDDLAFSSGGVTKLVGLTNPIDIETALIEANLYLRGSLLDTESFDFVPAPAVQKKAKALIADLYKRNPAPKFRELVRALKIRNAMPASRGSFRPYEQLFEFTTVHVERGCERVNFSINYALQAEFDLFLIDPAGAPVDVDGTVVKKVAHSPSHKIVTVQKPRHGVWTAVIFARTPQSATASSRVNLSVGAENRKIVVTGGCSKTVYSAGETVRVFASAKWDGDLSGLKVHTSIISGDGAWQSHELSDNGPFSSSAGQYAVDVPNLSVGQYKGVTLIDGTSKHTRADSRHALAHSNSPSFDIRSSAPKFRRALPFYFEIVKGR